MKKNNNNRLEYDKVNFDDDEKVTSTNTNNIDNEGVNFDDIKEYVLNDDAIDDKEKDKEEDDDKKKEELKKRILMGIIGAGIIIAILLLAFGLRKNKVAAVLSNDAQDRMINDLSGYIHEVAADKIDENTSKQIATDVIEDNFKDLLIQNFMSLSEEQVSQMIKKSLDKYMTNYYTKEEMDEINNNIVNNFMTTIADVRSDIDKIREDIANLVKDYEHYKEVTDANLKDLQDQIDVIDSEIDITEVETPLISYVWNVNIKKPTKPSKEVETDEDGNVISSGASTVDDTEKETSDTSTSAEKAWKSLEEHGRDTWGKLTEDFTFGSEGSNVSSTSVSGNFTSHTPYLYIQVTNPPEGKRIAGVRDDSGYMSTYQPDKYSILVDCGIYEGDWLADKNAGRQPTTREDKSNYKITIIWEDDPDQQKVLNVNPLYWTGSSWQEFTDGSYGNFKISDSNAWQSDVYMNVTKGYTYSINATRTNRSNVYVDKITKVENGTETTIGTTSTGVQTLNADTTVNIYYKFTYDVVFNPNPTSVTSKNIYGDTITTNPTGSVTTIKNIKAGKSITMPSANSLSRTGYEFVGWSTNPSYSSLSFSSSLGGLNRVGTTVTPKSSGTNISNGTTITFYAIWKPISYTVHYDMNLANEEQIPDKRVRFDETVTAGDNVTREDYEFRSWQVYDGSNYGGYTNNTNTDPSVGIGTKSYINANENFKNLRSSDGTVTLVAIWKHFTDADGNDIEKPNANTSNSDTPYAPQWKNQAIDSPAGYFYYSDTPIVTSLGSVSASGTQIGYYLNTNQTTNWQYKRQALFTNGDKATTSSWYYIDSYGYDYVSSTDTGNVQTVTSASFTSNKSEDGKNIYGTGYNTINLTDDNQKLVIAWVIMKDTWYDSHISYDETTTYHDTDGYTSLIGDNDIPTLEGIDKLENIVGLDKSNFTDYIVSLIGHDNISGLNLEKSSIVITNYDNSQVVTIGKADNQELDEYNRYTHIDWSSFDVMTVNLENFADNLFNGDYGVTYHLEDNVGNVLDNTTNSSVFDLKVEAKTKQGIDTAEAELIKGEYFTLTVSTFGYANAVRIKFPENWYISERYPLYIYTGSLDGEYDAQLLVEITSDVLYVDKESNLGQLISNTDDGTWIQQFIIITLLYADSF